MRRHARFPETHVGDRDSTWWVVPAVDRFIPNGEELYLSSLGVTFDPLINSFVPTLEWVNAAKTAAPPLQNGHFGRCETIIHLASSSSGRSMKSSWREVISNPAAFNSASVSSGLRT